MTLCDYAENPKKREGTRKRSVRVAALHVKEDERRMKVKMEKVVDITKKCFYIYNSFVVYLQKINVMKTVTSSLSLPTLVHFSIPVLPLVTSRNKHSISPKWAFITERVQNVVAVFQRKKQKQFISQILLKHNQWKNGKSPRSKKAPLRVSPSSQEAIFTRSRISLAVSVKNTSYS